MKIILSVFLLHLFISAAVCQDTVPDQKKLNRPKIGLVLSGGGARGFAHIGVLKILEENRIPVDFVAGASMGALVGSLYSTGRTPEELETLVKTLKWEKLLSGATSYDELTFRRKQDRRNLPGGITLGGKDVKGLKLPGSLNAGHNIGLVIDNLMLAYSDIGSFDDLPIPFRCVATDMVNAETVVLQNGSLQQALRATMAIPAVFAPVELNGRVLADGGVLNNIPTDVAKSMGADIIIVVNVETQIGDRAALLDLIGVLGQTLTVATIENSRRSLRQADIVLAPDLQNFSTGSFGSGEEIIALGYEGAKQKAAILKSLSLDENAWQEHLAERRRRIRSDETPFAEFLAVVGADSQKEREIVAKQLGEKNVGKKVDKESLESDLTKLTGTRRFDSLGYEIKREDGRDGLLIRNYDTRERGERRTVLDAGFEVNNTDADATNFNARARLTFYDLGTYGSEWRNDLSIGSKTELATEYFRPFGESRFFIAPNALYREIGVDFFQNGDRLAEYSFETVQAGIDLGYSVNRDAEARFGFVVGNQRAKRRIGDPLLPNISGRFSAASVRFDYDGLDDSQIPTRGVRSNSSITYYFDAAGISGGLPQAETNFSGLFPVKGRYSALTFGAAGTSFGKTPSALQQFSVGGLFNVGGYGRDEFRGSNLLRGGFGFLRETYALPAFIGGKVYLGGWYEGGSVFEKFNLARYRQSATGGALMETPLGPIFIGGSLGDGGRGKFYFSLGRFF